MKKSQLWIALVLVASAPALAHDCALRLALEPFREELRAAQVKANALLPGIHKKTEYTRPFPEADLVRSDAEHIDEAVISLGSGPDVLRPIANFPLARDIHLVDHMRAWGEGPQALIDFLLLTLRQLPGAKIEVSTEMRVDFGPKGKAMVPTVIIVNWLSPSAGSQWRRIHMHPIDYNELHENVLSELLNPAQKLVGIVATGLGERVGARLPKFVDAKGKANTLMGALHASGTLVLEYFPGPLPDQMTLAGLKKACTVTETGNDTFMNQYLPRLYLITPTR